MEKLFQTLLLRAKVNDNVVLRNELRQFRKEMQYDCKVQTDALKKRILELEYEKELLTANYESLKNYYGQD